MMQEYWGVWVEWGQDKDQRGFLQDAEGRFIFYPDETIAFAHAQTVKRGIYNLVEPRSYAVYMREILRNAA